MQWFVFIVVYPFLWLIASLPFRLLYALSDGLCVFLYYGVRYRRKVVRRNLRLAFPDLPLQKIRSIERKFYRHLCDLFLEMVKSLRISQGTMEKRFVFKNLDVIRKYEAENRSIVLICGHYASWEWMLSLGKHVNHRGFVVYMPLANRYFDRLVQKIRRRYGVTLIPRKETIATLIQHKEDGILGIYGFASDQSPSARKAIYWRTFMGVTVPVFTGAELLAKKLNHVVMYLHIDKVKRGYYETTFRVITETPAQLEDFAITDVFYNLLEEQIKTQPEYYFWTHNRWKHRHKAPEFSKN